MLYQLSYASGTPRKKSLRTIVSAFRGVKTLSPRAAQGCFPSSRTFARTALISSSLRTPPHFGIAPLPLWIVSRSWASVRVLMYAASWKFRGLGLSALEPGPSPWPSGPWQSAHRCANTRVPRSPEIASPLGGVAAGGGVVTVVSTGAGGGALLFDDPLALSEPDLAPPPQPTSVASNAPSAISATRAARKTLREVARDGRMRGTLAPRGKIEKAAGGRVASTPTASSRENRERPG